MSLSIGSKNAQLVHVVHLNGLEHVNITSNDVRTGKISISVDGEKIIGTNTEYFLENNTLANALASDINRGKTLYVNGELVTGSYDQPTISTTIRGRIVQYVANETITAGNFVKIVNTNKVAKVTSDSDKILGIALSSGSSGSTVDVKVPL